MLHIPQELVDKIINHLDGDRPSLLACSLVCRSWLPPSRATLSVTLEMNLTKDTDDHVILTLMHSPHCTFHKSIKRLALRGGAPGAQDEETWELLRQRLLTIIGGSRLRTLQVGYQVITTRFSTLLCTHFATGITELELQNTRGFTQGDDLVGFIGAFVVLESLTIGWLELWHKAQLPFMGNARCSSILRRLDVSMVYNQPETCLWFFGWLAVHEVLPPIQTLVLRNGRTISKTQIFGDFVRKLGNSLRVLEIRFSHETER